MPFCNAVGCFCSVMPAYACMTGSFILGVVKLSRSPCDVYARCKGGKVCLWSHVQAQEHEFNTPLQLGDVSELEGASTAEDADTYTIELQRQDIIVMASDGVLDNLWIDDMSQIVYAVLKVVLLNPCSPFNDRLKDFNSWPHSAGQCHVI